MQCKCYNYAFTSIPARTVQTIVFLFQVIRMCARTRENLDSTVEFLTLHNQLTSLRSSAGAELRKLQQLKVHYNVAHIFHTVCHAISFENFRCWVLAFPLVSSVLLYV